MIILFKLLTIAILLFSVSAETSEAEAKDLDSRSSGWQTVSKNKKISSEKYDRQVVHVDKTEPLDVIVPIFINDDVLGPLDVRMDAHITHKSVYVPVEVLRRLGIHRVVENSGSLQIFFPTLEMEKGQWRFGGRETAELYSLPYKDTDMGKAVDIKELGKVLQIKNQYDTTHNRLIVDVSKDPVQIQMREEINLPISMIFDPFSGHEGNYQRLISTKGTSVISPSWFELTEEGIKVSPRFSAGYIHDYESRGFRVWPLITNQFDPDLTHRILVNKNSWHKIGQSLLAHALLNGFDGYNFDFENIHYADKERLSEFTAYLGKQLNPFGLYLSMDVTGYSDSPNWSLVYDRGSLSQSVDYLVLMAYDEVWSKSPVSGPVATYPWVEKQVSRLVKEVSSQKIILGIPFYMRIWEEKINPPKIKTSEVYDILASKANKEKEDTKYEDSFGARRIVTDVGAKSKTLAISASHFYKNKYREKLYWDDKLKLHYTEYYEDSKLYRIWFEDIKSLTLKLDLVDKYNLAGYAAWRKGFEDQEVLDFIYMKY